VQRKIVTNILRTPLLRDIFFACLVITVALPVYSVFVAYPAFTALLTKSSENDAKRIAMHLAQQITHVDYAFTKDSLSDAIIIKELEMLKDDLHLEKLQIFSKSGEILYSSNNDDIGGFNKEKYLLEIVDKGNVSTNVVRKMGRSREGRVVKSDVVETYVPIMRDHKLIGAFEIYYDITNRRQSLDSLLLRSSSFLFAIASGLLIAVIIILFKASHATIKQKQMEEERERLIIDLQDALAKVKTLKGMLPICSVCKKIRDDKGYWNQIEAYIRAHSGAEFSHGICPDCAKKLYGDILKEWRFSSAHTRILHSKRSSQWDFIYKWHHCQEAQFGVSGIS